MLRNYLKTAFRNLFKYRSYTLINVIGLSLGITCSLFLFLLISYWLSFDKFHQHYDHIYRIVRESGEPMGQKDYTPGSPLPMIEAIRTEFPEVEASAFVTYPHFGLLAVEHTNEEIRYYEEGDIAYMEPSFYQIFGRTWIAGEPATALDEPNELVLSEKMVHKFFGDIPVNQALGKSLMMDKKTPLKVTGIVEDHPENTDFPFNLIISFATVKDKLHAHWGSTSSDDQVYVQLHEGQSSESINARFPQFVDKYYGKYNNNHKIQYLQPLADMHYNDRYSTYSYNTVPKALIWTLTILAFFLVLTACVNFVNLSTAISVKRSREVGIRKVLGGTRGQLIRQFIGETTIITIVAVFVALGLTELLLLKANPFLGLSLDMNLLEDYKLQGYLLAITIGVSLLSGLYPAFVQSGYSPVKAMKNLITTKSAGGFTLRRGLVVFQFFISQTFIIGTIVLFTQMKYMQQADLGFDQDAIVTLPLPEGDIGKKKTIRTELQRIASVENASLAYRNPSSSSVSVTEIKKDGSDEDYFIQLKYGDQHYMDLYGLQLVAGESLQESDTINRVVVNETLVKNLGFSSPQDALGQMVNIYSKDVPITGVVKDFHTTSLRNEIEPTAIVNELSECRMMALKIQPRNMDVTLLAIEKVWSDFYPEYTFDYSFVDEEIAEFYRGERKMSAILGTAALIAIFIGCLGLYGLITFMAEQRTKEIGIRKVLGASVASIAGLFSKEFIKLVLIAFVLSVPLTYFLLQKWLEDFTYRIDLGFPIFLAALLSTLIIALLTVGYRTLKASVANPIDALRNE